MFLFNGEIWVYMHMEWKRVRRKTEIAPWKSKLCLVLTEPKLFFMVNIFFPPGEVFYILEIICFNMLL